MRGEQFRDSFVYARICFPSLFSFQDCLQIIILYLQYNQANPSKVILSFPSKV